MPEENLNKEIYYDISRTGEGVKVLEDIEAIKQLHYDYIYALNARKWEELIDMFAEDMIEDGFPRGERRRAKKEIAKIFRAMAKEVDRTPLHAPW